MDQIAFHESEMKRHFEAGRFSAARWHCRIWTRLVAQRVFNDGTGCAARQEDIRPACMPSPNYGEVKGE